MTLDGKNTDNGVQLVSMKSSRPRSSATLQLAEAELFNSREKPNTLPSGTCKPTLYFSRKDAALGLCAPYSRKYCLKFFTNVAICEFLKTRSPVMAKSGLQT